MDSRSRAATPPFAATIAGLLTQGARDEPDRTVLVADGHTVTVGELAHHARAIAADLVARGILPGDPVVTMLGNGANHCALFLGIALSGALWVPLNPEARGPSLAHALATTNPVLAFATRDAVARLREAGLNPCVPVVESDGWALQQRAPTGGITLPDIAPDDVRAILFTSGTTGPPKGVMVTERMLMASAAGTARACDCTDGDVLLMWEPLHHIGGSQVLVMALVHDVRLVVVERFSASRLWDQVREHAVSKLHYLGGILEILLKSPPTPGDRDHPVRLAFGGGCRIEVWRAFQLRFGIPIREVYGMTEASSFTTVNVNGQFGSVGTPVPWFEVDLLDEKGNAVPDGTPGEFTVASGWSELFTPGYLNAPDATARLKRDGRLHTGDLGRRDGDGNYYFIGRVTDSLRRRGENISAWEVEAALAANPAIAETAVVGVPAEIGEHDILCFVTMRDGHAFDPSALARWARDHMPRHHVPRYWKEVSDFPRTPSLRIRKDALDRSFDGASDTDPPR
ncbi:MAG: AMP-binding protein [Rhodobiaceae bacterium]|nr:AMP-binding protein [Rhodobiaceae bacterium]MCC0042085.1 AMP-binding protein [Rhodobiaceae bacterium]